MCIVYIFYILFQDFIEEGSHLPDPLEEEEGSHLPDPPPIRPDATVGGEGEEEEDDASSSASASSSHPEAPADDDSQVAGGGAGTDETGGTLGESKFTCC